MTKISFFRYYTQNFWKFVTDVIFAIILSFLVLLNHKYAKKGKNLANNEKSTIFFNMVVKIAGNLLRIRFLQLFFHICFFLTIYI